MKYHSHERRDEVWTVLSGEGEVLLEGTRFKVSKGDTIKIPKKVKHTIKALESLEVIEVQIGKDITIADKIIWQE